MKPFLEKLWELYLSENAMETDPDKISVIGEIADALDALLAELDDDQRKLFHRYSEMQMEYHAQAEQDAFIAGIHFTVQFLKEAMQSQP